MDPYTKQAIDQLSSQFEIIGDFIDLALLSKNDGEQKIFNKLLEAYRPTFADNQRIILVQGDEEVYSYKENLASDALIFLQQSLQKIDISNFFVIVISANNDIEQELQWLRENYSSDNVSIGFYLIDGIFKKQVKYRDSFCVMPWMHLYTNPSLEITACCFADSNKPWGDLRHNTVAEIVNSERAKTMRLNMLNRRACDECKTCYDREKTHQSSLRTLANEKCSHLKQSFIESTNPDGSLKKFEPLSLDIRLNNICNLKCRTCDGRFSSQLSREEKKLFNTSENYHRIPSSELRQSVFDKIIDYVPHAKKIYFAGGEPLIMKEHYDILDLLIKIKKTHIALAYNTNFTTLFFKNKNVLDYWTNFPVVEINASLDGYGKIFEYVRHGAVWADIEKNLSLLKQRCKHVDFFVFSTISVFSAESVMELQKIWHDSGTLDINKFKLNPVTGDDYFNLNTLFLHHKKYLSDKIDDHCDWLLSNYAGELENSWREMQKAMWSEDKGYKSLIIAPINHARDIERKENFQLLFPQYADLFQISSDSRKLNLL